jgi:hypothetical protein
MPPTERTDYTLPFCQSQFRPLLGRALPMVRGVATATLGGPNRWPQVDGLVFRSASAVSKRVDPDGVGRQRFVAQWTVKVLEFVGMSVLAS